MVLFFDDNTREYIENREHFSKMLYDKLGKDAEDYFNELVSDLDRKASLTQKKVDTDLESYEASFDSMNAAMSDVVELLEEMQGVLEEEKKMGIKNKQKMETIINKAINTLMDEI